MFCERCRAAVDGEGTLVERMDNASDTPCGCEQSSVSELSPGVVGDEEELHFLVCDPGGMLDGRLNPDFLRQLDKDGLSVLRGAAGNEEFTLTLAELKPRWAEKSDDFMVWRHLEPAKCVLKTANVFVACMIRRSKENQTMPWSPVQNSKGMTGKN